MSASDEPTHQGRRVSAEVTIDADGQAVWDAWTLPDRITRWFVDFADGDMNVDPKVRWGFEGFGEPFEVTVFRAESPTTLIIGGPSPTHEGITVLQEITLEPRGGSTTLRIVQSGFRDGAEWDDEVTDVGSGWKMAFALLKYWLERYPESERRRRLLMRPVSASKAAIRERFTAAGLARWWVPDAPVGDVLVDTGTEVTVAWPSQRGAVGLKSFAGPTGRLVALDVNVWGAETDELVEPLEAALERLVASLT